MKQPATIVSMVALFAALSGGAIAGVVISGSQIKNRSIPEKKLTRLAVRQLRGQRGPAGAQGAQGAAGPAGPAGIATVQTVSQSTAYGAFGSGTEVAEVRATCPSGSYVVGGAANASTIETPISTFAGATSYIALSNNEGSFTGNLTVTAICASGPGLTHAAAHASAVGGSSSTLAARMREQLSQSGR